MFRVRCKKRQIKVKSRLSRSEEINNREMLVFSKKIIRGLMIPNVIKSRTIEYSAQGDISLRSYLNREIEKNEFFLIIAQVVEIAKMIEKHKLNINNLVLNMKYVFIDSDTAAVSFIYQPIISNNVSTSVYSFIADIVYLSKVRKEEPDNFLTEFSTFLSQASSVSVTDIERYIKNKHPQAHKQLKNQIIVDGQKKVDMTGSMGAEDEGTSLLEDEGTSLLEDEGTSLLDDFGDEGTSLLSDPEDDGATGLLDDDGGTMILNDDEGTTLFEGTSANYPYLLRLSTYDRVDINKPVFRIGKEKSYVDYFVSNNNAISRLHADIITQGQNYFIRDNNSTNRSFVNGIAIAPNQDSQIFDGDQLMLANEAFEFHCE